MTDTLEACPHCDSSRINGNAYGGVRSQRDARGRYRCSDCGRTFDETRERPARGHTNTQSGDARKLADASPDEVGQ